MEEENLSAGCLIITFVFVIFIGILMTFNYFRVENAKNDQELQDACDFYATVKDMPPKCLKVYSK